MAYKIIESRSSDGSILATPVWDVTGDTEYKIVEMKDSDGNLLATPMADVNGNPDPGSEESDPVYMLDKPNIVFKSDLIKEDKLALMYSDEVTDSIEQLEVLERSALGNFMLGAYLGEGSDIISSGYSGSYYPLQFASIYNVQETGFTYDGMEYTSDRFVGKINIFSTLYYPESEQTKPVVIGVLKSTNDGEFEMVQEFPIDVANTYTSISVMDMDCNIGDAFVVAIKSSDGSSAPLGLGANSSINISTVADSSVDLINIKSNSLDLPLVNNINQEISGNKLTTMLLDKNNFPINSNEVELPSSSAIYFESSTIDSVVVASGTNIGTINLTSEVTGKINLQGNITRTGGSNGLGKLTLQVKDSSGYHTILSAKYEVNRDVDVSFDLHSKQYFMNGSPVTFVATYTPTAGETITLTNVTAWID